MSLLNSTEAHDGFSQQFQRCYSTKQLKINGNQNLIQTPVKKFKQGVYQANQQLNTAHSQQLSQSCNTTAKKEFPKPFLEDISESELFQNFDQHIIVVQDIQDQESKQVSDIYKKLYYSSQAKIHIAKLEFSQSPTQKMGSSMKKKSNKVLIQQFEGLKLFDMEKSDENDHQEQESQNLSYEPKTPPKKERKDSLVQAFMGTPKKENPFRDLN